MKVAVLSGASRGLGYCLAHVLAQEGYALALGARSRAALESLTGQLKAPFLAEYLDVGNPESVYHFSRKVISHFGRVDVLVNNAGIGAFKRLEEFSLEEFDQLFDVNVRGAWLLSQAFLGMLKKTRGLLIMVSSDVSCRVFPTGGPYSATKAALRAIGRTFQLENPDIRMLELRPGRMDTWFFGSPPGGEGSHTALRPEVVGEVFRSALRLPPEARLEELVIRSSNQVVEY
uniref:NADP-dependent 3-hydroxy acid dehydrogenase YdfG n=1 Tax=Candidatus Kentrum sp. FM TaxID=2126340 RepID=A0A450WYH8_9GAMM|nr:MAG: NADP-dependent 3-hydroxy acid dehydrogenase YdfG [Candidatus Kentron sp. FM]VFJ76218.1 MAG: NADP-dependent 3-hydroxy acid dehydrogenase YdfG [Candidatus Kentron sp. FM]VFK22079.1 MAG: NADP-dependent 3-hydroxy acid dehydrogenase YdfG [Candidatus Kentron sp. FM]